MTSISDKVLEKLIIEIAARLKKHHLKITTAESCTAGGLSYWLTSLPGSSDWFERGFVTYSNESKMDMLGVQTQTIADFGAVSAETVEEMAKGALAHSLADISIAITGIAGPDGGSIDKPIGTVWFAWAKNDATVTLHSEVFSGDRQSVRLQSIKKALEGLLEFL